MKSNSYNKNDALNKIYRTISQKREKGLANAFKENEEFIESEVLHTEPSPFIAPIIGGLDTIYRTSMGREGTKQTNPNKIQKGTIIKDRVLESFRSPNHGSIKSLATGPLTARNINEQRIDSKATIKSVWSPRENGGNLFFTNRTEKLKQASQENMKPSLVAGNKKKEQYNLENHNSQTSKNPTLKQVTPTITLTTGRTMTEENEKKENKLYFVSKTIKNKNENINAPKTKQEKQILLKRYI